MEDQEAGEGGPVLGLAQAATQAQKLVVAARLLAEIGELHRLPAGSGRQGAREVFERGRMRGRSEIHRGALVRERERTP